MDEKDPARAARRDKDSSVVVANQLVLEGKLHQHGIYPVEQVLPTDLFLHAMESRDITIHQNYV
jgi:saccharopine dehydrogenase-like NADP-dependent oxidoreductase